MRYWSLVVALTLGGSALLGAMIWVGSPLWALAAVVAVVLILTALQRPELALLGILVTTSSIIYESTLPLIPIPLGSLHIPDVIALALVGLIAARWLTERDFTIIRTPIDGPVFAFYGVTFLLTVWAVRTTTLEFNIALRGLRVVSYYLVFFLVTNLIRSKAQLSLLFDGLFALATVVAAVMFAQFIVGDSHPILPGRVETLMTEDTTYKGIARILPPGQSLVMVGSICTLFALLMESLRPNSLVRAGQVVLLGLGLIFTFSRIFWLMSLLALGLFVLLVKGQERRRSFEWSMGLGLATVVIVLMIFTQPESQPAQLLSATAERLNSMMGEQVVNDKSLRARDIEYEYAIPQVKRHLLTGLGAGARYRPFDRSVDRIGGFDGRAYIHNGHLAILLQSGLPGYLCLLWVSACYIWRGFKYWRHVPDSRVKGIMLGFTLVYMGGLFGNITSPMFVQWYWTPVFGLMFGANEVIIRLYVPEDVRVPQPASRPNYWYTAAAAYRLRAASREQGVVETAPAGSSHLMRYAESTKRYAVELYRSGKSRRQIARELGVSPQSVGKWIRIYGQEKPADG